MNLVYKKINTKVIKPIQTTQFEFVSSSQKFLLMDRNMESIGSCSLDVDAHCSDISDKSGSLNFPTPISVKNTTRELTNNIRERCTITTTSYVKLDTCRSEEYISTTKITPTFGEYRVCASTSHSANPGLEKDGNYFLKILKDEQARLLALAALAEKYIDALTNNPDITEDTFGLLRSASGKARLLVSKKMKQFEGLCHNNLNRSPEEVFPTTLDDLEGFWDMVYLQVAHVDSIFADIEQLKSNDWQRVTEPSKVSDTVPLMKSTKTSKPGILKAGATGGATANVSKPLAASNSVAAMKREAQRKRLLEMKRQCREALAGANNKTNGDEVVGDSNTNAELLDTVTIVVKNSN